MNIYTDYSKKCPNCHQNFYSATSLLEHFFSHIEEEESTGASSDENGSITIISKKKHKKTNNNESSIPLNLTMDETLIPWKYCKTIYEDGGNTNKLLNKVQLNNNKKERDKTFECRLCSKKFGWSTDLKRHLLIHTGERPFKCSSCQAAFTRNFLLKKHFARAHKKVSEDESKILDIHVHANVTEIKLKMKEIECQK